MKQLVIYTIQYVNEFTDHLFIIYLMFIPTYRYFHQVNMGYKQLCIKSYLFIVGMFKY